MILYTRHYEELSRFLLGAPEAWIDKPQPNFAQYTVLRERLLEHKALLYPWMTLWPAYESEEEYLQDLRIHSEEIWSSSGLRKEIKAWAADAADQAVKGAAIFDVAVLAAEVSTTLKGKVMSHVPMKHTETIISEGTVNLGFEHQYRQQGLSTEDVRAKLNLANKVTFSPDFIRQLMFKLPTVNVEECTAEYRRYLFMVSCSA